MLKRRIETEEQKKYWAFVDKVAQEYQHKMEIKEYVSAALRTESCNPEAVRSRLYDNAALRAELNSAFGSFIAAARRLDIIKKHVFYGKPTEFESQVEEAIPDGYDYFQSAPNGSRVFHAILGTCTEAGELLEAIDAVLHGDKDIDIENMFEELGDGQWYFAVACDAFGFNPNAVLERNIAKLKARYPERFTMEAALNRDLDKEKDALVGEV